MVRIRIIFPIFLALCFGHLQAQTGENEWLLFQKGGLALYCQQVDAHLAESILTSAAEERTKIEALIPAQGSVITIILAPTEAAYTLLTGKSLPLWSSGAANPGAGIIYLKSPRFVNPSVSLDRIISHELSHILLGSLTGFHGVDRWFDEGLAEYVSGPVNSAGIFHLARSAAAGDLHSFEALNGMLQFSRPEAGLAYLEARSAVDYIIREFGADGLKHLIRALSKETDLERAVEGVFGISMDAFETGWKQNLRSRYRWAILMDFPAMLGVLFILLFFTALAATAHRARRKQREWEDDDA